eukprot:6192450-Pleurochrysis_carterae.AAC.2
MSKVLLWLHESIDVIDDIGAVAIDVLIDSEGVDLVWAVGGIDAVGSAERENHLQASGGAKCLDWSGESELDGLYVPSSRNKLTAVLAQVKYDHARHSRERCSGIITPVVVMAPVKGTHLGSPS